MPWRWEQEDQEFKVVLDSTVGGKSGLRPRIFLKNKKKKVLLLSCWV